MSRFIQRHKTTSVFATVLLVVSWCSTNGAFAQARKPPEVGYAYPPVVAAGQTTEVTLGGYDWTDDLEWFVHHPEVKLEVLSPPGDYLMTPRPYWTGPRASYPPAPIPREVRARLIVDANVPPGPIRWQVANANGPSGSALVLVTNQPATELVENRSRDLPQVLASLPCAVSGRLSRLTEVDRYRFVATKDGLVCAELWGRRLGSDFNGQIEIYDGKGQLLTDFADTVGTDGLCVFSTKAGETYMVAVHDVDFRGDRAFIYRLVLSEGPRVTSTLPTALVRGTTTDVEFVGWGIASGKAQLEFSRGPVTAPADANSTSMSHPLMTAAGPVSVTLPLTDKAEILPSAVPQPATGPAVVSGETVIAGHWPMDRRELHYAWEAQAKETWSLSLKSVELGGAVDVRLSVIDPDGKVVGEVDDLPGSTDAAYVFSATKAGRYTAIARSLTDLTGNPAELFRLELRKKPADFALGSIQRVSVPLAGKNGIKVDAIRSGGFTGPITLVADGLPKGVTPSGKWEIAEGQATATVTLEAVADADVACAIVRIQGTATIDGAPRSHHVLVPVTGNLAPRGIDQRAAEFLVAVTLEPPFEIKVIDRERQREVHRGTTYQAELEVVRKNSFAGPLQIAMTAKQDRDRQGVRGPLFPVPDGTERVLYPVTMPEWLSTDLTRRIIVHGVAKVPDPKGRLREVTAAADARITMILEGALLKLAAEANAPVVRAGEALTIPVRIARSAKLPLEARVELVVPEELKGLVSVETLVLPPGKDSGTLTVQTRRDTRILGEWTWEIRATALEGGTLPVVSVTDVNVVIE